MSIWGKILGGVAGFAMGGPLGALVGAALGHAADSGTLRVGRRRAAGPDELSGFLSTKETLFAIGVVVLSAKLSKCDGVVKRAEIDAFKKMFRIPQENLGEVGRLFDQARGTHEGFEPFADRMGETFADNRAMLEEVLSALFFIARADGPVNRAEEAFLAAVHLRLGLDRAAWDRARGAAPRVEAAADPYAVLGLTRTASDDEIRGTWRRLMRENHPDSLAARGVPADFVESATERVAEINAAWDRIKRERGL